MSRALIVAAPHAIELVKEGLQLCSAIMEYRHATIQIEMQRQQMHRQADLAMQQEKNQHALKMQKMQQISANFNLTLAHNRSASQDTMQMYKAANDRANQIMANISQPNLPNEVKMLMLETYQAISTELSHLTKNHYGIAQQSLTAYAHMCDQMRDEPNIFTDIN
ncbi:hypothetical protein [Psychrobacter lutiphocae]|uniref:hypothetical protein n=1 Tax=Psychrobacter lutiphocae TaxID=540500 RepID=UPI0003617D28|nr:hypothetical protein [Psychrobacter lutiphocae]